MRAGGTVELEITENMGELTAIARATWAINNFNSSAVQPSGLSLLNISSKLPPYSHLVTMTGEEQRPKFTTRETESRINYICAPCVDVQRFGFAGKDRVPSFPNRNSTM